VPSGWGWVVGGGLSLEKLKELTGIDLAAEPPDKLPEGGLRNLSDWVIGHRPGPLRGGDVIERGGLRAVVRKVRRQKVFEAQIGRADAGAAGKSPQVTQS